MTQTSKHPSHSPEGGPKPPKIRVFYPPAEGTLSEGRELSLSGEQAHYLGRVLRLKPGAVIGLFNGDDGEWRAELTEVSKQTIAAVIGARVRAPDPCPPLTLAIAPIRKERLEWLVEKAAELGVTHVQLVQTEYTQAKNIKLERLERIAAEAAEQCERVDLPSVGAPILFSEFLDITNSIIAPIERLHARTFRTLQPEQLSSPTLLIGPEGGFSPNEQAQMLTAKDRVTPLTLGQRLLRAETAAIAGLTLIQSLRGGLDLS